MRGRGKILIKILEILEDGVMSQVDFVGAMLTSGYGASMSKIDYEYEKRHKIYENRKEKRKELMIKKERLQKFLSKLKHDGLIEESEKNSGKIIISKKGKNKLAELRNKFPDNQYTPEAENRFTIISFDIPEDLRSKRDWFREVLKNLGLEMIHKSVWVSKIKIPKQLILDLESMDILKYIEIFEITKTGSLRKTGKD